MESNKEYFNHKEPIPKEINPSIPAFGNRIYGDQTLYEYLLEFLLVFVSRKERDNKELCFKFHNFNSEEFRYFPNPRVGLKRFIFYKNSKSDTKYEIDDLFYNDFKNILKEHIQSSQSENIEDIIQEFLYGFSAVLKTRSWYAQSLLPLVPEMIFSETIGNKDNRKSLHTSLSNSDKNPTECETTFNTTQHAFLARGGEIYYLHIFLGLNNDLNRKLHLEKLLNTLLNNKYLSNLTNFLENLWEKEKLDITTDDRDLLSNGSLYFIPNIYKKRGIESVNELINLLSCNIDNFKKLELFAHGMMLQIFRMLHERALEKTSKLPLWVLDIANDSTVKKLAVNSYDDFENSIEDILKLNINKDKNDKFISSLKEGKKHSINLIRKLGKEIGFIIPIKGANMRMTLSENLIKFLVLSIVKPNEKMEFHTFLDKLYDKFGIVIGSFHGEKYLKENNLDRELAGYFHKNKYAFQELLKKIGFLRDLSDATSIVENPYDNIEECNDL